MTPFLQICNPMTPFLQMCTQWPPFYVYFGMYLPDDPLFVKFCTEWTHFISVLYWMTPYLGECTNVPNDPYFEHGRGTPPSLQIGSAPPGPREVVSLIPLSNQQGSLHLSSILTSSRSIWWPGDSMWMWFETSELVELGFLCSRKQVWKDLGAFRLTNRIPHICLCWFGLDQKIP